MTGWVVVVSTPKYIEEVAKATDKELSQRNHLMEVRNSDFRLGLQLLSYNYVIVSDSLDKAHHW
jgi:hypothetical protein